MKQIKRCLEFSEILNSDRCLCDSFSDAVKLVEARAKLIAEWDDEMKDLIEIDKEKLELSLGTFNH